MKILPLLTVFTLAVSSLVGCNKADDNALVTSTTTTNPSAKEGVAKSAPIPAGWKTVTTKEDGISIGIPPNWSAIDLTVGDMRKAMEEASKDDPRLAKVKGVVEHFVTNKSTKLMVLCQDPGQSFTRSLNIVKLPTQGSSMDELVRLNNDEMEKSFGIKSTTEKVKLPAGDAVLSKSQLALGRGKISARSYMLIKGDSYFVITVSLPLEAPEAVVKETERMAATVNLGS